MTATRRSQPPVNKHWDVLANGWTHSGGVVGTSRIRAVESKLACARHPAPALHRHLASGDQR